MNRFRIVLNNNMVGSIRRGCSVKRLRAHAKLVFCVVITAGVLLMYIKVISFLDMPTDYMELTPDYLETQETSRKIDENAKFWYHLIYANMGNTYNLYIHRFYLNDREERFLNARTFITMDGNPPFNAECNLYFKSTVIKTPVVMEEVSGLNFIANGKKYYTFMVSCYFHLRDMKYTLEYVSFIFNYVKAEETEKIPVVIPEKRTDGVKDSIHLCLSPQYGKVTDNFYAPYIIQWLEMLKILGISQITWWNGSMTSDGIYVDKVLNYYTSTGFINFKQVTIPYKYNKSEVISFFAPTGEAHANEILRPAIVNDCLYRNMYKQWYILHTDKDELIIPYRKNQTYQNYIKSYIDSYLFRRDKKYASNLPSLSVPSSFFYLTNKKVRPNIPDYFPLLKFTYRQPIEPHYKNIVGYAKSFVNPRKCHNLWNHRCMNEAFVFLPEKDIQTHHYRWKCNPDIHESRDNDLLTCETEEERVFEDNIIGDRYNDILRKRTLDVLKKINYK